MIISITGNPGSGKSTVAKLLAEKLEVPWYSVGDLRGKMAQDRGMTIDELNTLGETEDFTDKEVDEYQTKLGETEKAFVIDGRISWHFIPQSFKIFLDVDPDVAAQRIIGSMKDGERSDEQEYQTIAQAKESAKKRVESDRKRFEKYYSVNILNMENYDLVLDTSNLSIQEMLKKVLDSLPLDE